MTKSLKKLDVFTKCNKTLLMSATILDIETFCSSVGLEHDDVKVIRVGSDFPLQNRPIYPLATAYLNYDNLHKEEVKAAIAKSAGLSFIKMFIAILVMQLWGLLPNSF